MSVRADNGGMHFDEMNTYTQTSFLDLVFLACEYISHCQCKCITSITLSHKSQIYSMITMELITVEIHMKQSPYIKEYCGVGCGAPIMNANLEKKVYLKYNKYCFYFVIRFPVDIL